MENSKYWYFRFTKEFVDDEHILYLESLPLNKGILYIWIYLKMCSRCMSMDNLTWYIPRQLPGQGYTSIVARAIGMPEQEVAEAISYFASRGFLQIIESDEAAGIYFNKLENYVGESSKRADRKRARLNEQKKKLLAENSEIKQDEIKRKFIQELFYEEK